MLTEREQRFGVIITQRERELKRPSCYWWEPRRPREIVCDKLDMLPETVIYPAEFDFADPALDTAAQTYEENCNFIPVSPAVGFAQELARFIVPDGKSGFVKGLWTWHEVGPRDPVIPWIPPGDNRSGNLAIDPYILQRAGVEVRWHLRMFQGTPPAALWNGDFRDIPGYGFGHGISSWTAARFIWGTPAFDPFLLVPKGFTVRLFVEWVRDVEPITVVGGRLWGFTQTQGRPAIWNARHAWQ